MIAVVSRVIFLTVILGLFGCDYGGDSSKNAKPVSSDLLVEWLRNDLIVGNLEPRLSHGLLPSGFYQPILKNDWSAKAQQKASLISQTRFIYLMAMGYEITSDARYLDALMLASDYLLTYFANPAIKGHWFREVKPDGEVSNSGFHAYGHTHVVFALAHAFKISKDSRYFNAAMSTWLALDVPRAVNGEHSYYDLRGLNLSMHLFESILVLYKATNSVIVREDLQKLGDYIITHFYDQKRGFFAEELTQDLKRKVDGEVRLGHSIEMAFLLSRAVDAGLPDSYLTAANSSVDFVARMAAEDPRGIIPHTTDYSGKVRDAEYYWWCQTELLRGLGHFSIHRNRTDLATQFQKSLTAVQMLFIDPTYNGWYKTPNAVSQDKGQQWKVGYHVAMMVTEIMRLKDVRFQSGNEVLL